MAYATAQNVIDRVGNATAVQLTSDSGSTVNQTLIDEILSGVHGQIDAAVRKRTAASITLADYPSIFAVLKRHAIAMAIYTLAARRPPVPEDWKLANQQALDWLAAFAKGEVDFPDAGSDEPPFNWGGAEQNASTMREET